MQDQPTVPYGYCQCGCGQQTEIAQVTRKDRGWVAGEPKRLIKGHNGRKWFDPTAVGYCECGCGTRTTVAPKEDKSKGWVRGRPLRFARGHNTAKTPVSHVEYIEDPASGCWIWQRAVTIHGYGFRQGGAHRYVYERERGPIPAGLHLDHLCRNTLCVNPAHLEPVTMAENTRRGRGAQLGFYGALSARLIAATTTLSHSQIADLLGVRAHATVGAAIRGESWRLDTEQ